MTVIPQGTKRIRNREGFSGTGLLTVVYVKKKRESRVIFIPEGTYMDTTWHLPK